LVGTDGLPLCRYPAGSPPSALAPAVAAARGEEPAAVSTGPAKTRQRDISKLVARSRANNRPTPRVFADPPPRPGSGGRATPQRSGHGGTSGGPQTPRLGLQYHNGPVTSRTSAGRPPQPHTLLSPGARRHLASQARGGGGGAMQGPYASPGGYESAMMPVRLPPGTPQ